MKLGVDVNLRDYKGATPLHRAKDVAAMQVIMKNSKYIFVPDVYLYISMCTGLLMFDLVVNL